MNSLLKENYLKYELKGIDIKKEICINYKFKTNIL